MIKVADVLGYIERLAPAVLAESWDNVGLILGDRQAEVRRVMTCLTITEQSAQEAITAKADLIVTHHPVLFRPIQRLTRDDAQGRMLLDLLRAGISIYSPHTAWDSAPGGINDRIARRLNLVDVQPLRRLGGNGVLKIVVFVPEMEVEPVAQAMFQAGAGIIGEYRQCSFRLTGTGTFLGSELSNPSVGRRGRHEEVREVRLELVCPADRLDQALAALRGTHSYEEPAYDIYRLVDDPSKLGGAGRVGHLPAPLPVSRLAQQVKTALQAPLLSLVGPDSRQVQTVAIACGSGSDFLPDARRMRCDVLVTGEATFHRQLEAAALDLPLILAGHYCTERFAIEELAELLGSQFDAIEVWASRQERDPVQLRL